jgi:hypothetical protein
VVQFGLSRDNQVGVSNMERRGDFTGPTASTQGWTRMCNRALSRLDWNREQGTLRRRALSDTGL